MSITTINATMPNGVAGDLIDSGPREVDSVTSEETVNGILPGIVVGQGAADHGVLLLVTTGDELVGVAMFDKAAQPGVSVDATTGAYLPKITFGCAKRGRLPMVAESAMVPGDEVHIRVTPNGTGKLIVGAVLPGSDTTKTIDASAFMHVVESGDATNPPIIGFDFYLASLAAADS